MDGCMGPSTNQPPLFFGFGTTPLVVHNILNTLHMDLQHLEARPRIKTVEYTTQDGEEVSSSVLILPAIISAVPALIRKNSNDTEWRLVSIKTKHPTKGVEVKQAQLFEKSYELHADSFAKDMPVEVMIQRDGDGKGFGKVQLPEIERFDVDAYAEAVAEEITETA